MSILIFGLKVYGMPSISECNLKTVAYVAYGIIDNNYDNYAKKIHLSQYKALEKDGYVFVHFSKKSETDLNNLSEDSVFHREHACAILHREDHCRSEG